MEESEDKNVAGWYDEFSKTQLEEDINWRNESIQRWLEKFGLKEDSSVLEIGCGIGTQTQLLAEFVKGKILANDISTKSVELARQRLKDHANVSFLAGDIVRLDVSGKFDVILLPDVLEHIPIKDHPELFKRMRSLIKDDGFILIHIPNPRYLEWCRENKPEVLQIIDQPIHTDLLANNAYANNLVIHHLETYSIWIDNNDYQVIVLKPNVEQKYSSLIRKKGFVDKLKYKLKNLNK